MLNTIIWIVVIVFVLFLLIGISENKKEAKKRIEMEAEDQKKRKALFEELESNKNNISNYGEIEFTLKQMNTTELGDFIKRFKRRYLLIEKYGEEEGEKLYKHQYWLGMTEEQVVEVKGEPSKIEIEALKTKTKRVLIYGNKSSGDVFTVVNGIVERFVDR